MNLGDLYLSSLVLEIQDEGESARREYSPQLGKFGCLSFVGVEDLTMKVLET